MAAGLNRRPFLQLTKERNTMKRPAALLLIVVTALAAFAETSNSPSDAKPSPAERSIAQAKRLMQKNPKDFEAYNALALALSRRGRETSDVNYYAQAEEAVQQSSALSPGNFDGARTHVWLLLGKTAEAEKYLQQALTLLPGYHYALGNLAKVRIQQKRYDEAVQLLQQRYEAAPHAENLFDLAEALRLAGRSEDAKKAFAEFEQKSLLETNRGDNSNRELIFYYADYAHEALKALEVAKREFARRHDVYTLDSYAWALHVNGQDQEARKQIEAALAVGLRDAKLIRHAGEIALATGDRAAAEKYLREAADLNTAESWQARATLARLSSTITQ